MDSQATSRVAIDVAKDSLQAQTCDGAFELPNNAAGFAALLRRARRMPACPAGTSSSKSAENTRALQDFLHQRGETLTLLPAARVRAFAASEGVKAKVPLHGRARRSQPQRGDQALRAAPDRAGKPPKAALVAAMASSSSTLTLR